jgi:hypothetical protein
MDDGVRVERMRTARLEVAHRAQAVHVRAVDLIESYKPLPAIIVVGVQPVGGIGSRAAQLGLRRPWRWRGCRDKQHRTEQNG